MRGTRELEPRQRAAGAAVTVDRVSKSFGTVTALRDVSLRVEAGEFIAIGGASGSGKSTLLSLIGSLDRPDSGTITVDGAPIPEGPAATNFRREVVGFVFQDSLLLPFLTAEANVETPLIAAGVARAERRRRVRELLVEAGIGARTDHLPHELSGGERQRVALARALAGRPRLLLADEPTGALDSVSSERVLDLVGELRDMHGMTVIVASHDPAIAARADRAAQLVDGSVASH